MFATTVGKLRFENPLVVGAGCCKTLADVKKAAASAAAGMELGTITKKGLPGNPGTNFYAHFVKGVLIYTQNSLGLPNPGKDAVTEFTQEAIAFAHARGKLIGINVTGDTVLEMLEMVTWAVGLQFDWVTINPACPNKFVDGKPASIFYYDFGDVTKLLETLRVDLAGHNTEVWWKMTPDNNTLDYQLRILDALAECSAITGIVANNTVPHTLALNVANVPTIAMKYGGQGGPAVMPKALADIDRIKSRYDNRFVLVGAGGATCGRDILDFQLMGASIVQATSAFWAADMNYRVFGEMLGEYSELPYFE